VGDSKGEFVSVPYTFGIWRVRSRRSDEFVAAWTEFAEWTTQNVPGAGQGTLLRDLDDQNRFMSTGPWESLEVIERWRSLDGFTERVARLKSALHSRSIALN
jgi:heme-degrading monooxygenase HmoA